MLRALVLLLFVCIASSTAQAAEPVVRVIADESVLAGRLERLQAIASSADVTLEWSYANALPQSPRQWIAGTDLLIVEAPLDSARQRVEEKIGEALAASRVPRLEATTR